MKKYIIQWNSGHGPNYEEVEADSHGEAEELAYQSWREDCEGHADYEAIEYNKENCQLYGIVYSEGSE